MGCSGTSVAFIGVLNSARNRSTVQIDNGTVFDGTINDDDLFAYKQWFQSPTLPDGIHTINITVFPGTLIDYAIVNAGNQTRLVGRTIIVDNDSPSIVYSGHWIRRTSRFNSNYFRTTGYPYGNSTHDSSTPGDTFTFQFTGAQVKLLNIANRIYCDA